VIRRAVMMPRHETSDAFQEIGSGRNESLVGECSLQRTVRLVPPGRNSPYQSAEIATLPHIQERDSNFQLHARGFIHRKDWIVSVGGDPRIGHFA
jgi:hypothetical protein